MILVHFNEDGTLAADYRDALVAAVRDVWQQIAPDVDWRIDNDEALELCLDAGRLGMLGHGQAQMLFDELMRHYTFSRIRAALAEEVTLPYER